MPIQEFLLPYSHMYNQFDCSYDERSHPLMATAAFKNDGLTSRVHCISNFMTVASEFPGLK